MRTTITVDDQTFEKLMQLAGTDNKTEAVNLAISSFIRQAHLRRFKELRGKLDLPSNEASDLEQSEGPGEESE
jgi:Arc/MetJ family transcription regulator